MYKQPIVNQVLISVTRFKIFFTLIMFGHYAQSQVLLSTTDLTYNPSIVLCQLKSNVTFNTTANRELILVENKFQMSLAKLGVKAIRSINQESKLTDQKVYDSPVIIELNTGVDASNIIESLRSLGIFEYVELDLYYKLNGSSCSIQPNDSLFSKQWSLTNDPTSTYCRNSSIDMDLAWLIETGDTTVIVCIIDSGIKPDHPEFEGRLWKNPGEIEGNSTDDDGNGLIDDVSGWDFTTGTNVIKDTDGHGTSIAGIIAATGNDKAGFAGIDWNCKIMSLKVIKGGIASYSDITSAVYYAVGHGADVINISIGGSTSSTSLEKACDYAKARKIPVVISMGNENTWSPSYPAAYKSTIAVGALDCANNRSKFAGSTGSNYGQHIDLIAPGSAIPSLSHKSNTDYSKYIYGTSFAAPHVAGVISLMKAINGSLTVDSIKSLLILGARDRVGPFYEDSIGWDIYFGHGSLNAFNTLSLMTTQKGLPIKKEVEIEACKEYKSPSGKYNWTTSGYYYDTLAGKSGCDTFIRAHVSIGWPYEKLDTITSCGTYKSPSGLRLWDSSGFYRDTIRTTNKCDSTWAIQLEVIDLKPTEVTAYGCSNYTSPSGKYTFTSSTIFQDTVTGDRGCDSILSIDLTIYQSSDTAIKVTACRSYKSPSGMYNWNYTGKFTDLIRTKNGCDSTINIDLTIENLSSNIDFVWPNLKCDIDMAQYQWLDCKDNYKPVADANNQYFRPSKDGDYAVEVRQSSCIDTADCYSISTTGMDDKNGNQQFRVYPNPATKTISIPLEVVFQYQIYSHNGQLLREGSSTKSNEIDVSELKSNQLYFLMITHERIGYHGRFVKMD